MKSEESRINFKAILTEMSKFKIVRDSFPCFSPQALEQGESSKKKFFEEMLICIVLFCKCETKHAAPGCFY